MAGQALVSIKDKQWQVSIATTYQEFIQGLAGLPSIPAGTGMLFDLGYETIVTVTTVPLLFPIDIVFISNTQRVTEIYENVPPGKLVICSTPSRYFLEVNAGETQGIKENDLVNIYITALEMPAVDNRLDIIITMASLMMVFGLIIVIVKSMTKTMLSSPETPHALPQTVRLRQKWYEKGVEAGKTDGWMDIENTISETLEDHPEIKDAQELVWYDIDLWEQTNHFNILYGSKMWADAREEAKDNTEKAIDIYSDLKSQFWEGYFSGRKAIGIDIFKKAADLLKTSRFLPQTTRKQGKRGEVLYEIDLGAPRYVEEILLHNDLAELRRFYKRVVVFRPTQEQRVRIMKGKGRIRIYSDQVVELPPMYAQLKSTKALEEHSPNNSSPVCSACGTIIFRTGEKYYHTPVGIFCFGCVPRVYRRQEYEKIHKPPKTSPAVISTIPHRSAPEPELEYFADSPEFLAQTIDSIGYRDKLDTAFREAIAKAKGLR